MTDADVLEERREHVWSQLGVLHEDVVARLMPGIARESGEPVFWPDSALGKLRLIRRPHDYLMTTCGLSNFYDPELASA
jgi:hypothetical protein